MLSWPPRSEEWWLNIKDVLKTIVSESNVGPQEAQRLLVEACASNRVRSRYLAIWEGPPDTTPRPYMDGYLAGLNRENRNAVLAGTQFIDRARRLAKGYLAKTR